MNNNFQIVLNSTPKEKAVCWGCYEYIIEKDSWLLIVREIELTYDDKDNKVIMVVLYFASMMMVFANLPFYPIHNYFVPRRSLFNFLHPFLYWTYV